MKMRTYRDAVDGRANMGTEATRPRARVRLMAHTGSGTVACCYYGDSHDLSNVIASDARFSTYTLPPSARWASPPTHADCPMGPA